MLECQDTVLDLARAKKASDAYCAFHRNLSVLSQGGVTQASVLVDVKSHINTINSQLKKNKSRGGTGPKDLEDRISTYHQKVCCPTRHCCCFAIFSLRCSCPPMFR